LQRALHRFLQALEKDQCHPVAGGNGNELAIGLARLKLRRFAHELIELLHHFALLVDEQFRITDYVHEQDVRDFEMKMWFLDVRHLGYLFYLNRFTDLTNQSLKARIVTQWIPPRKQTQLAVRDRAGNLQEVFQLFKRKIFSVSPGMNNCEIS
jgi:hypothetical protein